MILSGVGSLEDQEILDLYFSREEIAIEKTRQKYGARLFFTAQNILQNREDAEECVSDTMLKAWENIPPQRPNMFGAFLVKITRNLSLNRWKANTAERRGGGTVDLLLSELEDCIPEEKGRQPEQAQEARFIEECIHKCLEELDPTARMAFIMRYFHGESIEEICRRFSFSESKAKSMLFRTRKKLKEHLEKQGVVL